MSVVDQADRLPTPFDPQLQHDGIVLQRATLKLEKQASIGRKRVNERLSHRRNVLAESAVDAVPPFAELIWSYCRCSTCSPRKSAAGVPNCVISTAQFHPIALGRSAIP